MKDVKLSVPIRDILKNWQNTTAVILLLCKKLMFAQNQEVGLVEVFAEWRGPSMTFSKQRKIWYTQTSGAG